MGTGQTESVITAGRSRNWTPGVVAVYQLLYKLHTDEVPASEVKSHTPENS